MCDTKKCSKCGEVKALNLFPKNKGRKDGLDARCKQCNCDAANAYRAANLELVREKDRIRIASTAPEKKRQKWNKWANANRDHVRAYARVEARKLYHDDPEKFRARAREYHAANRDMYAGLYKRARQELRDSYVATTLRMKTADVPPELLALKREQLAIKRMARELKKAATKPTGENE